MAESHLKNTLQPCPKHRNGGTETQTHNPAIPHRGRDRASNMKHACIPADPSFPSSHPIASLSRAPPSCKTQCCSPSASPSSSGGLCGDLALQPGHTKSPTPSGGTMSKLQLFQAQSSTDTSSLSNDLPRSSSLTLRASSLQSPLPGLL